MDRQTDTKLERYWILADVGRHRDFTHRHRDLPRVALSGSSIAGQMAQLRHKVRSVWSTTLTTKPTESTPGSS
jgi:hypothetical protein